MLGPLEVLEAVLSEISQFDTGREGFAYQVERDTGEEGLAAVGHGAKPGATVDGGTIVITVAQVGLAGVEGGSHANRGRRRPGLGVKSLLQGGSTRYGIGGPPEYREPAVTLTAWAHDGA